MDDVESLDEIPNLSGQVTLWSVRPVFNGAYSSVFHGEFDDQPVAVKVLKEIYGADVRTMQRKLKRERTTWGRLRHPNVLPLLGFADDNELFQPYGALVSPWRAEGNACEFLKSRGNEMPIFKRVNMWKGVVAGVAYLHSHIPVLIHGDLKSANVLIDNNHEPQICDFGLVSIFLEEGSSGMTTTSEHTGTDRYLAYELVRGGETAAPTAASDMFALGCIGLEFCFLQQPYAHQKNNMRGQIFVDIRAGVPPATRPALSGPWNDALWAALDRCWESHPSNRIGARDLQTRLEEALRFVDPESQHVIQPRGSPDEAMDENSITNTKPTQLSGLRHAPAGSEHVANISHGTNGLHPNDPAPSQTDKLVPTTDEITRICPKFRILLLGKSGVGKSSLINQAFQVEKAEVSHSAPGKADIKEGIDHPRFILHDSQGFEPGEVKNLKTVQDFIKTRNNMPELKDKLHAIWICIQTPATGSRILEAGLEEILLLKRNGDLGKVPIIIVLTKYDALVKREDRLFDDSQCENEEISEQIKKKAVATLEAVCIAPLKEAIGAGILYAAVSTEEGYQDTLSDLIKLTFDNVKEHVAKEASIVTAMAQSVNSDVKVEALIDVGRFKYWYGLTSNTPFTGRKLLECLAVIHTDIVAVWSLKDPEMILRNQTFMVWMSEMVDKILTPELRNPKAGLTAGLPMIAAIATVVSVAAGPVAPVVVPIVAGAVFAKWVYDVYQNRRHTLKRLMAYIIDLTLIVQHIFCLMQGEQYAISRRVVNIISTAYDISSVKANVHRQVVEYVDKSITNLLGAQDTTFQKIVELIESNVLRVDSAQSSELRSIIKPWEGKDGPSCEYQFQPSASSAGI